LQIKCLDDALVVWEAEKRKEGKLRIPERKTNRMNKSVLFLVKKKTLEIKGYYIIVTYVFTKHLQFMLCTLTTSVRLQNGDMF
jgi:tRNA 2-selenouridine synthase SelU